MEKFGYPSPKLVIATQKDYSLIRDMSCFYMYDLSRYCANISGWEFKEGGKYRGFDPKKYFEEDDCKCYMIMVGKEVAGFILLNKVATSDYVDWNIAEFFIIAKFQNQGIGTKAAKELWKEHPGSWEISVLPENIPAKTFWKKVLKECAKKGYTESVKEIDYDKEQPKRVIFNATLGS